MPQLEKAEETLKRNNLIYEILLKTVFQNFQKQNYEETLKWASAAAQSASYHHIGRFSDARLETVVLEVGEKLDLLSLNQNASDPVIKFTKVNSSRKQVLHIVTTVYEVGGHTRLIKNWVNAYPEYTHSLLITNPISTGIPNFLAETILQNGGKLITFAPEIDLLIKARQLREIASNNFDYVILHHHPNDVIPIAALAKEGLPPVALVNHADHVFWLGSSIADLVVDFCPHGEQLSRERRFARHTTVVPYLNDINVPKVTRAEARRKLGISDNSVVLISIGSSYKYKPILTHNFFKTASKIIEKETEAHLYLIGLTDDQGTGILANKRIHFCGVVNDPSLYQIAADIYLDGFPLGGGLASIECVLAGACPVFAYSPLPLFTASRLLEFDGAVEILKTESEYIDKVSELINDSQLRKDIAEKLKQRIIYFNSKNRYREYANATFQYLDTIKHQPFEIPQSDFKLDSEDNSLSILSDIHKRNIPFLLQRTWDAGSDIGILQIINMMISSIQVKDTKLSYQHLRGWLGTIKGALRGKKKTNL